ncbi:DUF551 domain-containing protein [Devosia sp.]|uniref:DUF551 domain-containing protein n=1 Tax=Devosia sp. TaxID=1871048 RepID=UPI002FC6FE26
MNWLPIETAPRDGSRVLLSDGTDVEIAKWGDINMAEKKGWQISCNADTGWNYYEVFYAPTHWAPLPTPPGVNPPA